MNHNFASWELTQMLPEINPYQFIEDDDYPNSHKFKMKWYNIDDIITIQPSNSGLFDRGFDYLRDAWTWEDIRLYLLSKGFVLAQAIDSNNKDYHCINVWQWKDGWEGELLNSFVFNTYKEARKQAISYCIGLIKHN